MRREADEAEAQARVDNERQAALTEAFREEYENSDRGAVARQVRNAEKLMRSPGPVTQRVDHEGNITDEGGPVFGDPLRGPSS
jgi:hypothetical protein